MPTAINNHHICRFTAQILKYSIAIFPIYAYAFHRKLRIIIVYSIKAMDITNFIFILATYVWSHIYCSTGWFKYTVTFDENYVEF